MKATNWEFKNRAMLFGLIFGFSFPFYVLDPQNSTAALANCLGASLHANADLLARGLFAFATLLLVIAALIRTWASAYLQADVVYAAAVKTKSVVADGPYRRVRNPLYFANLLMAVGMGAMMSRPGLFVVVATMLVFCYRLILREEAELQAAQGEPYERYRQRVPRLLPSLRPRIPAAGGQARWREGFTVELWAWGFAAAVAGFAITLKLIVFFVILGVSGVWLFVSSAVSEKKINAPTSGQRNP
jgi:protein-S-isoprenylcysteine O-methyltransferase Ste14